MMDFLGLNNGGRIYILNSDITLEQYLNDEEFSYFEMKDNERVTSIGNIKFKGNGSLIGDLVRGPKPILINNMREQYIETLGTEKVSLFNLKSSYDYIPYTGNPNIDLNTQIVDLYGGYLKLIGHFTQDENLYSKYKYETYDSSGTNKKYNVRGGYDITSLYNGYVRKGSTPNVIRSSDAEMFLGYNGGYTYIIRFTSIKLSCKDQILSNSIYGFARTYNPIVKNKKYKIISQKIYFRPLSPPIDDDEYNNLTDAKKEFYDTFYSDSIAYGRRGNNYSPKFDDYIYIYFPFSFLSGGININLNSPSQGQNEYNYILNSSFDESLNKESEEAKSMLGVLNTGFVRLYGGDKDNEGDMQKICGYLWNTGFITAFKNNIYDQNEAILSLGIIPTNIDLSNYNLEKVRLAGSEIDGTSFKDNSPPQLYHLTNQFIDLDFGEISIPELYNSYLDYSQFTTITINLPFCGEFELDPDIFMSHTIKLIYTIDLFTGDCVAKVFRDNTNSTNLICQFNGNCLYASPTSSRDFMQFYQGIFNTGLSIASTIKGG